MKASDVYTVQRVLGPIVVTDKGAVMVDGVSVAGDVLGSVAPASRETLGHASAFVRHGPALLEALVAMYVASGKGGDGREELNAARQKAAALFAFLGLKFPLWGEVPVVTGGPAGEG